MTYLYGAISCGHGLKGFYRILYPQSRQNKDGGQPEVLLNKSGTWLRKGGGGAHLPETGPRMKREVGKEGRRGGSDRSKTAREDKQINIH